MSAPLVLISGVVTDLVVHRGEEEFVRRAGQQAVGVGAAAGLAVTGLTGAAAGASLAAALAGDSVEFFSCKVSGEALEGRFSRASFGTGDEVTAVLEKRTNAPALALAIKRASDSMLWMLPHCSRGAIAHRNFTAFVFCCLVIGLPIFGLIIYFVLGLWANNLPLELSGIQFMGSISLTLGLVASTHFAIRFYRQWLPVARQAEAIFAALDYRDPSRVDLPRDHKRYCKVHDIKWPYSTDGPWIYHYLDPQQGGQGERQDQPGVAGHGDESGRRNRGGGRGAPSSLRRTSAVDDAGMGTRGQPDQVEQGVRPGQEVLD